MKQPTRDVRVKRERGGGHSVMERNDFGIEQFVEKHRAYRGSRFAEVREAIFDNPHQKICGEAEEPPLPRTEVDLSSVLRSALSFGRRWLFAEASRRVVGSHADRRWGPDKGGRRRLIYPNGVCLTGLWEITQNSGYFGQDGRARVIGRYSTRCSATRRGEIYSFSRVGKLYPTADPHHPEPLQTASFFTQEDIGGDDTRYVNDAVTCNAPNVTPWRRRKGGLPVIMIEGIVFTLVDRKDSQPQLYQIAELGKPRNEPPWAPKFMRLIVAGKRPRIEGENLDFHDEILGQIFDAGDPEAKRRLTSHIEVTDEGAETGILGYTWRRFDNWRRIGTLIFENAVASYNGRPRRSFQPSRLARQSKRSCDRDS